MNAGTAGGLHRVSGQALEALPFREIWAVDFEFVANTGDRPDPVCMVARELRTGRMIRLWRDDLRKLRRAPFDTGSDALFVAYFAPAELGCFEALGWPHPVRILDLFCEFRAETNGVGTVYGNSQLGALLHHGSAGDGSRREDRDARSHHGRWALEC